MKIRKSRRTLGGVGIPRRFSEDYLDKRAAEVLRLLKGEISEILQASSICAQMNSDLDKELLPLFLKKLGGMSPSQFSRKVGIDRISRYGAGHTANLPTKPSVLYRISTIPHPEIEEVLRAEPFSKNTTAPEVFRIAKKFHFQMLKGLPFNMRRRGVSKLHRRRYPY